MRNRNLWRLLVGLAAFAIFNVPAAAASNGPPPDAKFTTEGGVAHPSARTIPWWSFDYTDPTNGVPYHISMVGSDPRGGGSTTVPTEIIPLKFNFVAGNQDMSILDDYGGRFPGFRATAQAATFDGGSKVAETLASPIFSAYRYPTDLGGDRGVQYGDAFMRAQFNKIGSSYHVKLAQPTVLPTVTINVPQNQGVAYYRPAGALAGTINASWFSAQIDNLMTSMHVDSQTLPIFLTDNVLLYLGNYLRCCVLGYHGATSSLNTNGSANVQTFVYAAYGDPRDYPGFDSRGNADPTEGVSDIHGLSHEVAEWLDDPFVNNSVQPWLTPTAPFYGCTGLLETGDPVVGVWFPLSGNPDPAAGKVWHPEDEVFLSWFARNGEPAGLSPWSSYYTFMGPRTVAIGGDYASWAQLPATC
jgi:hypothetical protein